jgi:hypothetical protein
VAFHNSEFARGQSIAASRARIANKLVIPEMNVVKVDVLVSPLDVINDIILTYHWATSTIVPALCSPGWSENSVHIWRLCRMRTVALSFSLLWRGMCFRLIYRSSAGLLVCQCFIFLLVHLMRLWRLPL